MLPLRITDWNERRNKDIRKRYRTIQNKTKINQEYTVGTSLQKEVKLWERNHMQKEI